jgi:diadenosine tetraphosphate (Ap4A) HIT family hydrolase
MTPCIFCEISDGTAGPLPENLPFAQNRVAYAKPALGSFVEGYSLIIAHEHVRSFSRMSPENLEAVDVFKNDVSNALMELYGCRVLVFEHGCGSSWNQRAGACIDHAHLHLIPIAVDIRDQLSQHFIPTSISRLSELPHIANGGAYLYLEDHHGSTLYPIDDSLPSQYIRQLVSRGAGCPRLWDWREHPLREAITEFRHKIAAVHRSTSPTSVARV